MIRYIRNGALFLCTIALTLVIFTIGDVQLSYLDRIHDTESIPALSHAPVAIILGASVNANGTPSDALRDRLLVGIKLYDAKTVDQLLLTGDDGAFHVNEVRIMKEFVTARGVPESAVLVDGEGYRTYESCLRAKNVLKIDKAIIVTQRFHIGRAVYLCNKLGIETDGVTSDLQSYLKNDFFWLRDLTSSAKAWFDVNVLPPKPPVE